MESHCLCPCFNCVYRNGLGVKSHAQAFDVAHEGAFTALHVQDERPVTLALQPIAATQRVKLSEAYVYDARLTLPHFEREAVMAGFRFCDVKARLSEKVCHGLILP